MSAFQPAEESRESDPMDTIKSHLKFDVRAEFEAVFKSVKQTCRCLETSLQISGAEGALALIKSHEELMATGPDGDVKTKTAELNCYATKILNMLDEHLKAPASGAARPAVGVATGPAVGVAVVGTQTPTTCWTCLFPALT